MTPKQKEKTTLFALKTLYLALHPGEEYENLPEDEKDAWGLYLNCLVWLAGNMSNMTRALNTKNSDAQMEKCVQTILDTMEGDPLLIDPEKVNRD